MVTAGTLDPPVQTWTVISGTEVFAKFEFGRRALDSSASTLERWSRSTVGATA